MAKEYIHVIYRGMTGRIGVDTDDNPIGTNLFRAVAGKELPFLLGDLDKLNNAGIDEFVAKVLG